MLYSTCFPVRLLARTKRVMQIHGISFKFIPFVISAMVFVWFSPWTNYLSLPAFQDAIISAVFVMGGLAFYYEGFYAWPKKESNQASMVGAIFFAVVGTVSILFGIFQWLNMFDLSGVGDLVLIGNVILIADMIMLFIGTIFEIVFSQRLSHWMAGKGKLKILN